MGESKRWPQCLITKLEIGPVSSFEVTVIDHGDFTIEQAEFMFNGNLLFELIPAMKIGPQIPKSVTVDATYEWGKRYE